MRDPNFIPKVVYAIDIHTYRWLDICIEATEREIATVNLIDFYNILAAIIMESYLQLSEY